MTGIGISRLVVSKILNHVERDVTAVYDRHSNDSDKRDALNRWDQRVSEILSKRDGNLQRDPHDSSALTVPLLADTCATWRGLHGG